MDEERKLDVKSDSSADTQKDKDIESKSEGGKDKDKNFAELRKKTERLETELAEERRLRKEAEEKRTLGDDKEDEAEDDEEDESKKSKSDKSDASKLLFERDLKKAIHNWNKSNKVSEMEWKEIQKRVSLKGDELDSEIEEKINDAYHSLPATRKKREDEIALKAKKEAMKDFQDEELDLGGGGDVDLGGSDEPRFNPKEKKWLKGFGVTKEEMKNIDKSSDSHSNWKVLDPNRQ